MTAEFRWIAEIDREAWHPSHEDACIEKLDLQRAIRRLSPSLQQALLDIVLAVPVRGEADQKRRYRARAALHRHVQKGV